MPDTPAKIRERYIEQMGLIAQADGLPRIAGRLLGLMTFDGRAFSFSELAVELQVSRGSISTNARLLEQLGVIERTAVPGDRQDYFQLADEPYTALIDGSLARQRKARDTVRKTLAALPIKGHAGTRKRLKELESFYGVLVDTLAAAR